jgi:hypothetical protein
MEQMTFLYTARRTFDKTYHKDGHSWDSYMEWSNLTHLKEVISLDLILNTSLVEPEYANANDWNFIHTDEFYQTNFFTTLDYVLRKMGPKEKFNLLAVVIEPPQDCKNVKLDDFEFVGYDLLDKEYGTSALTNLGGLNETFLPSDLAQFGLIDDYEKAFDVKRRLLENNPEVHHADTNVIAVWRHKTIGRTQPNR